MKYAIKPYSPIRTGLEATRRWPYAPENMPSFSGWFSDDAPPPAKEQTDWKTLAVVFMFILVVFMFVRSKDATSYRRY